MKSGERCNFGLIAAPGGVSLASMNAWRIPVDLAYVRAVGRAFYNFDYLEWIVISTVSRISPLGADSVPPSLSSDRIADTFENAIVHAIPPLPAEVRSELNEFLAAYRQAIVSRNGLLSAHPFTASGGMEELGTASQTWDVAVLNQSAMFCEQTAIRGNALYHGELAKYGSDHTGDR